MNELPPSYSPRASTFITTSTSNSPPLTPISTIDLPSYATSLSGRNEEPIFASAAPYFELRPPPCQRYDRLLSFRIAVNVHSHLFNIPFPQPEEIWLERDVQFQDWMTFINFMIPPETTRAGSMNKVDVQDVPRHDSTHIRSEEEIANAEHGKFPSIHGSTRQGQCLSQQTRSMHINRVDFVIKEWNEDFFFPRGLEIIRDAECPTPESCSAGDRLESMTISDADGGIAQGYMPAEIGCPRARKKVLVSSPDQNSSSATLSNLRETVPTSNPKLEHKFAKAASKGIGKVIKWDQALLEKIKDRDPQFSSSTPETEILFYQSVSRGDKSMIKQLLKDGVSPNVKDINGTSALFRAVSRGDSSAVKLLLDAPVDVDAPNATGETPIYRAVQRGDSSIVKLLLALPIDTNAKTASGDTPIYRAASRGDSTVVSLLLRHSPSIDVNARAANGKTALYRSVARGDSTIVQLLLRSGADIGQAVDGDLPISKATSRGNHTLAKMLSKKQGEQNATPHGLV